MGKRKIEDSNILRALYFARGGHPDGVTRDFVVAKLGVNGIKTNGPQVGSYLADLERRGLVDSRHGYNEEAMKSTIFYWITRNGTKELMK